VRTRVRIPVGTPAQPTTQEVKIQADTSHCERLGAAKRDSGAYLSYAPTAENISDGTLSAPADDYKDDVPSRSKAVAITPVQNRSGTISYRVTGSIRSKQRKRVFRDIDDAKACQQLLELERIHGIAASRPKISWLTQEQIRKAEVVFELLRGTGMDPVEMAKHFLRNPPFVAPKMTWADGLKAFIDARTEHLSEAHLENYGIRGRSFGDWIGEDTLLTEIAHTDVTEWLEDRNIGKKTWNNYRGDVKAIFEWFSAPVRKWIDKNPVEMVDRFSKRSIPRPLRQRLDVQQCRDLMAYLERNAPEWCTFFAVTLFAGVRPDMRRGEMFELARCVGRDGVQAYYHNGILNLTEEITKDGDPRETTVHEGLNAWLERYPPTAKTLCPGDYDAYMLIRKKFSIPHDGLRHTTISAHLGKYGNFALAAQEFGNSETIIRRHYNRRMSAQEADEFHQIFPCATKPVFTPSVAARSSDQH
jgi:hypothetical protein